MKIGEAEFEVDVPENKAQPMYDDFCPWLSGVPEPPMAYPAWATVRAQRPNIEATVLPKSSADTRR